MRKLQEGSLYIAIALYFLCYCSWGNPSSAFVRVFRAIQSARSPKISRPPDPLFIHRTPSEAPKTEKRTGVTPARKKRKKKKIEGRGVMGCGYYGRCIRGGEGYGARGRVHRIHVI